MKISNINDFYDLKKNTEVSEHVWKYIEWKLRYLFYQLEDGEEFSKFTLSDGNGGNGPFVILESGSKVKALLYLITQSHYRLRWCSRLIIRDIVSNGNEQIATVLGVSSSNYITEVIIQENVASYETLLKTIALYSDKCTLVDVDECHKEDYH
jgi:hypothetical protein